MKNNIWKIKDFGSPMQCTDGIVHDRFTLFKNNMHFIDSGNYLPDLLIKHKLTIDECILDDQSVYPLDYNDHISLPTFVTTESDFKSACELLNQQFNEDESFVEWPDMLSDPNQRYLVIKDRHKVVAGIYIMTNKIETFPELIKAFNGVQPEVYTNLQATRKGYEGRRLARRLRNYIHEHWSSIFSNLSDLWSSPAMFHILKDMGYKEVYQAEGEHKMLWIKNKG